MKAILLTITASLITGSNKFISRASRNVWRVSRKVKNTAHNSTVDYETWIPNYCFARNLSLIEEEEKMPTKTKQTCTHLALYWTKLLTFHSPCLPRVSPFPDQCGHENVPTHPTSQGYIAFGRFSHTQKHTHTYPDCVMSSNFPQSFGHHCNGHITFCHPWKVLRVGGSLSLKKPEMRNHLIL